MTSELEIVGYHGTFEEHVQNILNDGFQPEFRPNHWLGQGTYFYTEKKLAHWFINRNSETDPKKKGKGNILVIIKALINEKKEKVLNLDNPEEIDIFFSRINDLYDELKHVQFTEDEHINMCTVIDILAEVYGWNVIIKTFEPQFKPSYGAVNTHWFDKNVFPLNIRYKETQICIRNNNCVKTMEVEYPNDKYRYPANIRFS
ncbi:hypothetical protein [Heyndrickxia camelliae]|uniref:DUF3990 domain-containing protein n=1 Tax=Heyndrickxia camelliae TaxID=1707093 RepID=A0A2N3LCR3_9BACI|nr:hypothetical protein [Heyndrickxia camelliae]PKR82452.1 hypothetical protein CWO92_24425 [Heyndrickxia camelliae]